jgi:outer membrane receptor protein involved in Fe transport
MSNNRSIVFVFVAVLLASPNIVSAQEQGGGSRTLEEIVVTATKREVSSHDLPVSISAMSEEALKRIGAVGFGDYLATMPGVSFPDVGAGRSAVLMRGVSTDADSRTNLQNAVSVLVDDMPQLNRWSAWTRLDMNMFDIERVEVMRGPQGTLFGSGAMGGVVRIITNKPDASKSEMAIDLDYAMTTGGDESTGINAMMNIPLIEDKLALRVIGFQRENGGWVDDIRQNPCVGCISAENHITVNINDGTSKGGRVMLGWTPSDELLVRLSFNHQSDTLDHSNWSFRDTTFGGAYESSPVLYEYSRAESEQFNLVIDYDFGGFSFLSSTSWGERDSFLGQDLSGFFDTWPACQGGTVDPIVLGCSGINQNESDMSINHQTDSLAQDFRLTSQGGGKLQWVAGVYYFEQNGHTPQPWQNNEAAIPGQADPPDRHNPAEEKGYLLDALYIADSVETAIYGEATYAFTDQWSITAGLRWYDTSFEFEVPYFDGIAARAFGTELVPLSESTEDGVLPKIAISFAITDSINLYAQGAEGYRLGQINFGAGGIDPISGETIPLDFKSDSLWSNEIGLKAFFLDNRLKVNFAIFQQDWEDIQLTRFTASGLNYTDNAGDASADGVEVEVVALPSDVWELGFSATSTDTNLDSVLEGVSLEPGTKLPGTPDFSANAYAQWTLENLPNDMTGYMRLDYRYVSEIEHDMVNTPETRSEAYSVLNLRAGVYFGNQYEFVFYVKNLADDDAVASADNARPLHTTGPRAYRLRPRTVGISVRGNFEL